MSSALHTSTTVNDERHIEKAILPDRNSAIVMGGSMAGCSRPVRICATYAQKEQPPAEAQDSCTSTWTTCCEPRTRSVAVRRRFLEVQGMLKGSGLLFSPSVVMRVAKQALVGNS